MSSSQPFLSSPLSPSPMDRRESTDSLPGSGVATPRPDPSDKRLPGIKHTSYLGQVGSHLRVDQLADSASTVISALDSAVASGGPSSWEADVRGQGIALLHTAPSSPGDRSGDEVDEGEQEASPLLPHEQLVRVPTRLDPSLTPPISSRSSLHQPGKDSAGEGDVTPPPGATSRHVTPARRDRGISGSSLSLRLRRSTFALLNPLSSVITISTVHAAHISKPTTTHASTLPNTPYATHDCVTGPAAAPSSYFELKRLTEAAVISPRKKNTPPQTPRNSSNDGTPVRGIRAPTSTPLAGTASKNSKRDLNGQSTTDRANATGASGSGGAPVGSPKGKLSVKVMQAKGLRPSRDPYVVCVFEWNESISKGPRSDASDATPTRDPSKSGLSSGPIKRAISEMGRAVAIPMKSRQNSTNSVSESREGKDGKLVINPNWDHEATL